MATEIIMPKAGMDMVEGTVIKWLVKEGDKVDTGDPILEILTDKVNMEVEAETTGTILKILAEEGEVLPVMTVIGYMGEEGDDVPDGPATTKEEVVKAKEDTGAVSKKSETTVPQKQETTTQELDPIAGDKVRATPAARYLARERDIPLGRVTGSGPKGRIQKVDVETFKALRATPLAAKIAKVEGVELDAVEGTGHGGKITKEDVVSGLKKETPAAETTATTAAVEEGKDQKIIPMKGIRKIIADRMIESQHTAATVSLTIEVDMTASIDLRSKIKDMLQEEKGVKITYTDLLIMAVTKSLVKYPLVNATMTEEGILVNDHVNMGIAVGLDSGLMVPVINNTEKMNLTQIVESRSDIVGRTVKGKIKPNELQGSTFTISNLGMFDTVSFTSIINQPNSAILSVGAILERMRVVEGKPEVRNVMNLTITLDHRVMDGVEGAKFLQYLKGLLEEPTRMLL
ncbi:2-oxo acid dehydrogenase subunit E2 [Alkalibacter rhizosphaerae]|uniref:Dihydrolipoamide acetyltransferase component of pyruvate dehydrogenase complex n=1 Tax=Alkalibacter rhizosphaerae TaxID=2815577 RepID=A0A974XE08_9FIRM|nr:dihydrolipoamide acetyltransferase family protein [Alkalibacter rhizosphaerae]QSX08117.1 2-oxo acid dehydrogenase subunit E2 [Alkalibacter rhizosphaerae]